VRSTAATGARLAKWCGVRHGIHGSGDVRIAQRRRSRRGDGGGDEGVARGRSGGQRVHRRERHGGEGLVKGWSDIGVRRRRNGSSRRGSGWRRRWWGCWRVRAGTRVQRSTTRLAGQDSATSWTPTRANARRVSVRVCAAPSNGRTGHAAVCSRARVHTDGGTYPAASRARVLELLQQELVLSTQVGVGGRQVGELKLHALELLLNDGLAARCCGGRRCYHCCSRSYCARCCCARCCCARCCCARCYGGGAGERGGTRGGSIRQVGNVRFDRLAPRVECRVAAGRAR
jgi:hypothetical protein